MSRFADEYEAMARARWSIWSRRARWYRYMIEDMNADHSLWSGSARRPGRLPWGSPRRIAVRARARVEEGRRPKYTIGEPEAGALRSWRRGVWR